MPRSPDASTDAAAIEIRPCPAERPGFTRYEVYDAGSLACIIEIATDADHEDLRYYLQSYHAKHPRAPHLRIVR